VFLEVSADSSALDLIVKHGVYVPLAATTWSASHLRLSRGLSPADLVAVAMFYMTVDAIISGAFPPGQPNARLAKVAPVALAKSVEASRVLEARGWRGRERRSLYKALGELAPKS
jgi:hypothetical protein